ncbi:uncharacterized protein LOC118745261 [Rhagoletis pomonella]|uniref:uncharacterized protein LOC118745261 n=1 Tax=Rhagoletis pomonella TaxID=28610 RepID=UPI00178554A7|nr:uncharacterized protein LOC118745261 [Rhagoletis pomonella]
MYYTVSLLAILLGASVQNVKSRYISLSFNVSLKMDEDRQEQQQQERSFERQQELSRPTLSAAVLRSCMKETELSMAELKRFSLSLLTHDPEVLNSTNGQTTEQPSAADANDYDSVLDEDISYEENAQKRNIAVYEDSRSLKVGDSGDEALQCFAYCLYEQLGLFSKGVYMEDQLFAKLYAIVGRERHLVKQCMDLNAMNICESSYEMHLCYARLKISMLEEESQLRDALGYGERADERVMEEEEEIEDKENEEEVDTTQASIKQELD